MLAGDASRDGDGGAAKMTAFEEDCWKGDNSGWCK